MPTNKKRIQAFLSDELHKALSEYKETHELSVSEAVVKLLESALKISNNELTGVNSNFLTNELLENTLKSVFLDFSWQFDGWCDELKESLEKTGIDTKDLKYFSFNPLESLKSIEELAGESSGESPKQSPSISKEEPFDKSGNESLSNSVGESDSLPICESIGESIGESKEKLQEEYVISSSRNPDRSLFWDGTKFCTTWTKAKRFNSEKEANRDSWRVKQKMPVEATFTIFTVNELTERFHSKLSSESGSESDSESSDESLDETSGESSGNSLDSNLSSFSEIDPSPEKTKNKATENKIPISESNSELKGEFDESSDGESRSEDKSNSLSESKTSLSGKSDSEPKSESIGSAIPNPEGESSGESTLSQSLGIPKDTWLICRVLKGFPLTFWNGRAWVYSVREAKKYKTEGSTGKGLIKAKKGYPKDYIKINSIENIEKILSNQEGK